MVQYFKGDVLEKKMEAVGTAVTDATIASLTDMYNECFDSAQFILMLYDAGRMPFSERIKREVFYDFIKETLARYPFTGTFDSYLFILAAVFGPQSTADFTISAPGKLAIAVNAAANIEFEFIAREFVGGGYVTSVMITQAGEEIIFIGISGIETEYELQLLFSEIMPAGITPDISLTFFVYYDWISDADDDMVTQDFDQIIFVESGA